MYVANMDEDSIVAGNKYSEVVKNIGIKKNINVVFISAKIESELISITEEQEKKELMKSLNINNSGLEQFIIEGFKLLNLITFFTSGEKESRAWTIPKDMFAPQAARKIHTDFERGFIAAEVISYNNMVESGGERIAKNNGKIRTEGKDYIVQDGDVILFRFNV